MKRTLSLLLALVLVLATALPAMAEQDSVTTLTYYNADGQEDPWTNPVALALTAATGVRLETTYPVSDDDESVALMIADDKYPDLIYAKGDAGSLYEAGAFIDMEPLIDQYGPNIKKFFGKEYNKLRWSDDDPGIYQLSYADVGTTSMTTSGPAQIQYAVLKENDWKYPTTLAEYEDMIKRYLAAHPTTDDGLPMIGISLSAADWRWMITLGNPAGFIADAAPDNGQWLVDENYNCTYKHHSAEEKEYFRWLNRMYNEGILDPDFATQTDDDYIAKLSTGRVVAITDASWHYGQANAVLVGDGKLEQTYAGVPVTLREGQKSPSLQYQGMAVGWGIGISKDCKDPVTAIKFLDYLCSDEGQVLLHWGVEGVNYFVDENGNRYRTEEEIAYSKSDADYNKKTGVNFYVGVGFPRYGDGVVDAAGQPYTTNTKETVIAEYNAIEREAVAAWGVEMLKDIFPQASEFEVLPYSAIWAYQYPSELDEMVNILNEIAWPGLVACVTCSEADFEAKWQGMVDELYANNMAECEQMMTEFIATKIALFQE